MWVKETETGPVLIHSPDLLHKHYPNVSFTNMPITDDQAIALGMFPLVKGPYPDFDINEHKAASQLIKDGAQYVLEWKLMGLTDSEKNQLKQAKINDIQREARYRLELTDWSELRTVADIGQPVHLLNFLEFVDYRIKLRTIIATKPDSVAEWPIEPKAEWFTDEDMN